MAKEAYRVVLRRSARRAIAEQLREAVAAAALEFSEGRSTYRIVYVIDGEARIVEVLDAAHPGTSIAAGRHQSGAQ